MTERGSLDPIRGIARSSTDAPPSELAAPMQALVTAAVPSRDRSLPAALCAVAGAVGFDADESIDSNEADADDAVFDPIVDAVTHLEGYVRLRLALVTDEPSAHGLAPVDVPPMESISRDGRETDSVPPVDRDAAILASDFLHAGAYARVAQMPVSDRRRLECHRLLAEGSTGLTRRFLSLSRADEIDPIGSTDSSESAAADRYGAAATLAETAAAVGSAAAGASTETRTALRTYSHAVMTALASQSAAVADDIDPRASAVRVLTDETARRAVDDDREPDSTSATASTPTVERCLERARGALETLGGSDEIDEGGIGNPNSDASTPLALLERATRVPFHHDRDDR